MPTLNLDYSSSVGFLFDSAQIEFTGGGANLFNIPPYSLTPQSIKYFDSVLASALETFAEVVSGTTIVHNIIYNGVRKFFDGTEWVDAGPTDFNTAQDINDNAADLFPSPVNAELGVISYLISDDGSVTPTLTSLSFDYTAPLSIADYPIEADVRLGLLYKNGAKLGAMVLQTAFEATEADTLSTFFADLGVPVIWTVGMTDYEAVGLLDTPDSLEGSLIISTEYKLTMKAVDAASITRGQALTVDGVAYTIREAPRKIDDGSFVTMELNKV